MRPRKLDSQLPKRVYFRHGAYYHVREGKWTRLGKNLDNAASVLADLELSSVAREKGLIDYLRKKAQSIVSRSGSLKRARDKTCDIDADFIVALAQKSNWRCCITNVELSLVTMRGRMPYAPSIDRIDPGLGYSRGNVRIVCVAANLAMNVWGDGPLREMMRASRSLKVLDDNVPSK